MHCNLLRGDTPGATTISIQSLLFLEIASDAPAIAR
jgi:hypothetical protein